MNEVTPHPPSMPATFPAHFSVQQALACADTLLKDICETTEAYRRRRPGKAARALDSVMDSTLIATALLMHAAQKLTPVVSAED
ncbi:hypothetical protein [Pseudomonas sp.]|uniref:hypothetical protein n=1 Tax=Pseudomonas sp. TaxID=306 RepID=UPI0028B23A06|nr:hypothetical protein [Pseudomonas sp.]